MGIIYKKDEEYTSLTVLHDSIKKIHSYCFFSITKKDPDCIADILRKQCDEYHNENPYHEFHLLDEKHMTITYYGHAERHEVSLKSVIDLRIAHAIRTLNEEPNHHKVWSIRKPYDYAWIKKAIDCRLVPGTCILKFKTTQSFISYLNIDLCFDNIIGQSYKSTFNKYYNQVANNSIPFIYRHPKTKELINSTETNRRNAIVLKFIELLE